MYFYKCPNCLDIFYSEELYTECKCFKCGAVFQPPAIQVDDWILEAMKRCGK